MIERISDKERYRYVIPNRLALKIADIYKQIQLRNNSRKSCAMLSAP